MNQKQAKRLRRMAEALTVGMPKREYRIDPSGRMIVVSTESTRSRGVEAASIPQGGQSRRLKRDHAKAKGKSKTGIRPENGKISQNP